MKVGKKYKDFREKIDSRAAYSLDDAVKILKENAYAKFDETVELAVRLGVDPKKADQMVRGTVVLPHGTGKKIRVLVFAKGDPKNYIPQDGIERITTTFLNWEEEDKFSRIVPKDEIVKNDYNIFPSHYIDTADAEKYRPIGEIVEELDALETEAEETSAALRAVLKKLGV